MTQIKVSNKPVPLSQAAQQQAMQAARVLAQLFPKIGQANG